MGLDDFKAYFPIEIRTMGPYKVVLNVYAETRFDHVKVDNYLAGKRGKFWFGPQIGNGEKLKFVLDCRDWEFEKLEPVLVEFLETLSEIPGIRKLVINNGIDTEEERRYEQMIIEAAAAKTNKKVVTESIPKIDDKWDESIGLDSLDLNYTAHMVGCDGECFNFTIYFPQGAGQEELEAVRSLLENYEFGLGEDEYIGYIDGSLENGLVMIFLDLGNVDPEDCDPVIQGILLALNGLKDLKVKQIEKVLINE